MTQSEFAEKVLIAKAAASLYEEHGDRFTFTAVAAATGLETARIRTLFPLKHKMLRFAITSIPQRCVDGIEAIPDFQELSISESISQYVYQSFDLFNEHRQLTEDLFEDVASSLRKNTAIHFDRMIERDGRIPFMNRILLKPIVFNIMAWQYIQLLRYWFKDESDGTARTLELVDKSTALFQELTYSGILDKGVDFGKTVFSQFKGHKE